MTHNAKPRPAYKAPSLEGLLTIKQAADIAGATEYHVKSWVEGGWLPAYRPFGSEMVVVHPLDLQRFCEEHADDL